MLIAGMKGCLVLQKSFLRIYCCCHLGYSRYASCKVYTIQSLCTFQTETDNILLSSSVRIYARITRKVYTISSQCVDTIFRHFVSQCRTCSKCGTGALISEPSYFTFLFSKLSRDVLHALNTLLTLALRRDSSEVAPRSVWCGRAAGLPSSD